MSNEGNRNNGTDIDLTIVTMKGTVCIPSKKREKLGITTGTKMYWRENENGEMVLGKLDNITIGGSGGNGGNNSHLSTKKQHNGEDEKNV